MVEWLEDSEKRRLRKNVGCFQIVKWLAGYKNLDPLYAMESKQMGLQWQAEGF